jgi:hypothetical protein
VLVLAVLAFAFFIVPLNIGFDLALMVGMALAVVVYVFRWSRDFLIRMIVDYDANNGDGLVIIERLMPDPTLPETQQIPLQQAAEGSPEVNTRGLANTLVTLLKGLSWLRVFTIGDITFKGPAAPFGITMKNIHNPAGVKEKIAADWKKMAVFKNRGKEDRDRNEQIDRMSVAFKHGIDGLADSIALGIVKAQQLQNGGNGAPPPQPPPETPPPTEEPPLEPDPMEWEPVWSLRTARSAPSRALRPTPLGSAGGREELLRAKLVKKERPEPQETDEAPEPTAESEPPVTEGEDASASSPAGDDDLSQSIGNLEPPAHDHGSGADYSGEHYHPPGGA